MNFKGDLEIAMIIRSRIFFLAKEILYSWWWRKKCRGGPRVVLTIVHQVWTIFYFFAAPVAGESAREIRAIIDVVGAAAGLREGAATPGRQADQSIPGQTRSEWARTESLRATSHSRCPTSRFATVPLYTHVTFPSYTFFTLLARIRTYPDLSLTRAPLFFTL